MRSLVFTSVMVLSSSAFAAGPYISDVDAVGLGQAGADIASPNTLSAFWYNPAALAGQRGLRLQLEGGLSLTQSSYTRAGDASAASYAPVTNHDPLWPAVFAGVSYDFGIPDLAVGAAVWSPSSNHIAYPDTGPQQFLFRSAENTLLFFHLAVAYRLFKVVSLGATFGTAYFGTKQSLTVSAAPFGNPENPDFAIPLSINVTDPFTITENFGVRVEPLHWLAIGASIMPPYDIDAQGTLTAQIPATLEALSGLQLQGNKVELKIHQPVIVRAGIRFLPIERLALEGAFVYEGWSRFNQVTILPTITLSAPAINLTAPVPVLNLPRNYQDTYSARVGGELHALSFLTVRAGVNMETSATRATYPDLSTPDGLKFTAAAGVSVRVWKLWFDATYAHVFAPTQTVTNSKIALVNLYPTTTSPGVTLGNGKYNFAYDIFHLGLRANFFDGAERSASPSPPSTMPAP